MSEPSFLRIKTVLADALEQPRAERVAFVMQACASDAELAREVLDLLQHESEGERLSTVPELAAAAVSPAAEQDFEQIGPYRILGLLGQGGMGRVFEAEQAQPRRRVALKLLHSGLLTNERARRRFELESELLGRLKHPAIAQIFESGVLDTELSPRPWFAMELIDGQPLNHWATSVSRDPRTIMRLLALIAEGVQHAHQNGVVHRDLKPANILVNDAGEPRILDFGVARVRGPEGQSATLATEQGQLLGTLEYMSPEQIRGDADQIDARADIHALGVIAFELLTGQHPFSTGEGLPALVHAITEVDPPALNVVRGAAGKDLAIIVAKAMNKDPKARYQAAAALAEDITRWLSGHSILARKPSAGYALRRFAARNRVLVTMALLALISLVGGSTAIAWQARESDRARLRAEDAREQSAIDAEVARNSITYLKDGILAAAHPDALGPDAPIREVIERAAQSMEASFRDQPEVERQLRTTLIDVWMGLGLSERAWSDVQRVVDLSRRLHGERSPLLAEAQVRAAEVAERQSRWDKAEALSTQALATLERVPRPPAELRARAATIHGWILREKGEFQEAARFIGQSLEIRRAAHASDHPQLAVSLNDYAVIQQDLGELETAMKALSEALQIRRQHFGDDHTQVAQTRNNLGLLYRDLGRRADAAKEFREVLAINARLGVEDHPRLVATWFNLSLVAGGAEKEAAIREAHAMAERALPTDHFLRFHTGFSMGSWHTKNGSIEAGLEQMRNHAAFAATKLGERHPRVGNYHFAIGLVLRRANRAEEALEALQLALAIRKETLPAEHILTAYGRLEVGECLTDLQRYELAATELVAAHATISAARARENPSTQRALRALVALFEATGDAERAATYREQLSPTQ